jgi:uncharacterized SAM-binding protein YcdF (DUF218 family)
MFFVLSKIAGFLLLPSNFLVVLAVVGLLLLVTRWRRLGSWCFASGIVLLLLAGFLPAGATLMKALENRFPRWDAQRGAPDGVVVLGGAINPVVARSRGSLGLSDGGERVVVIARLARDYPNARIVFTSGDASLLGQRPAEADYLFPSLDAMGVPRDRVLLERQARNTAENAAYSKQLAQPKQGERWLVVTSAYHMPRAIGCFRRAGFDVEAYPVNWRTTPRQRLAVNSKFAAGLDLFDDAVHEWEGLLAYWLTGRTDALFPAP